MISVGTRIHTVLVVLAEFLQISLNEFFVCILSLFSFFYQDIQYMLSYHFLHLVQPSFLPENDHKDI
jgi:hypothetical protein